MNGVPRRGEVQQSQLDRVDAELERRLVHVRLDGPDLLRVAEAAERRGGHGVRQHAPGEDPDGRHGVRAVRREAALADRPVGDVGVRADEVVGPDVAEHDPAVASEAGPDVDLRGAAADGLERLLERQDEPDRPAGAEGQERDERLVLRVLLAAERATRIRREDPDLRERQPEHAGHDPLQPVRVLDRAPDRDAVAVRGGHEGVRLDGELGDHREVVRALDDDLRVGRGGVDVAPAVVVLAQDVGGGQRIVGTQRGILDERRTRGEGRGDRRDGGQRLALDPDEPGGLLGRVLRLGRDRRDRLAVVVRLADGDDRAVLPLRPEARHRLRAGRRRSDGADAGHGQRGARVDRDDPRPRVVDRHELDVQLAVEMDVGDVRLLAGDPVEPADAGRRRADHGRRLGPARPRGPPR